MPEKTIQDIEKEDLAPIDVKIEHQLRQVTRRESRKRLKLEASRIAEKLVKENREW